MRDNECRITNNTGTYTYNTVNTAYVLTIDEKKNNKNKNKRTGGMYGRKKK